MTFLTIYVFMNVSTSVVSITVSAFHGNPLSKLNESNTNPYIFIMHVRLSTPIIHAKGLNDKYASHVYKMRYKLECVSYNLLCARWKVKNPNFCQGQSML